MKDVLEALEDLSAAVDRRAWEAANEAMRVYHLRVREASRNRTGTETQWRDLLNRHRLLSMKMAVLRDDVDRTVVELRRGRAAASRYLHSVQA